MGLTMSSSSSRRRQADGQSTQYASTDAQDPQKAAEASSWFRFRLSWVSLGTDQINREDVPHMALR